MIKSVKRNPVLTMLVFTLSAIILSSCASLFDPKPDEPPTQTEDETSRMEDYVDCLRDKDRKIEDPPCLMK